MAKRPRAVRRTVGVVSSHPLLAQDIERVLAGWPFRLRAQQIDASPVRTPDVTIQASLYIVDGQLPRPTEESVISTITHQYPKSRIVILAESFPKTDAFRLLRLGVKGLLRYRELEPALPEALETVASGGLWVSRALLSRFLDEMVSRSPRRIATSNAAVSVREREVLACVLDGSSNKHIACHLHIAERTVKFHVSNLLAKFEVRSRQELIRHCLSYVAEEQ